MILYQMMLSIVGQEYKNISIFKKYNSNKNLDENVIF